MVRFRRQQAVILAASSLILLFVISTISNLLNNRRIEGYLVVRAQILDGWRKGLYPFDSKDEFSMKISKLNSSSGLCENLVANWSHFNMSTEYYRLLPQLSIRLKEEGIVDELHIPRAELTHVLHYLTSVKSIKTVCEVGFGFGSTSFNVITSNNKVRVFSFDYAVTSPEENVASKMSSFYSDQFGEVKLTVKFGNPTSDIQSSISSGQLPLCDMILINRANLGYKIANDVIKQLSFHSSSSSSSSGTTTVTSSSKSSSSGSRSGNGVIVLVGYPTLAGYQDGRAWEEKLVDAEVAAQLLKKKQIGTTKEDSLIHVYEELRCASRDKKYGFVIGRIV